MEQTLEQEFMARTFIHKAGILGGYFMHEYLQEHESSTGANLPPHILMKQADEYSNKLLQEAMEKGNFNTLYERAWELMKNEIPENTNLLSNTLN